MVTTCRHHRCNRPNGRPSAMAVRTQSLLPLVVALAALACGGVSALLGGWRPIDNPNHDPQVRSIARFAVSEHNKALLSSGKRPLTFVKVVSGESQVVAGTNYRLVIKADSGGGVHTYEAVVWDKPWQNFRKLTSFKRVEG